MISSVANYLALGPGVRAGLVTPLTPWPYPLSLHGLAVSYKLQVIVTVYMYMSINVNVISGISRGGPVYQTRQSRYTTEYL